MFCLAGHTDKLLVIKKLLILLRSGSENHPPKSNAKRDGLIGSQTKPVFRPSDSSEELKIVAAPMQDKPTLADNHQNENVIFAESVRVSDSDRSRLTFGSFGTDVVSSKTIVSGSLVFRVTENPTEDVSLRFAYSEGSQKHERNRKFKNTYPQYSPFHEAMRKREKKKDRRLSQEERHTVVLTSKQRNLQVPGKRYVLPSMSGSRSSSSYKYNSRSQQEAAGHKKDWSENIPKMNANGDGVIGSQIKTLPMDMLLCIQPTDNNNYNIV